MSITIRGPLSTACAAAVREVARALGLGHPEEARRDGAVELSFTNGAADCDADAFVVVVVVEVERERRPAGRWEVRARDGALVASAHDGARAVRISAGYSVSHDRARARAFLRGVQAALARCGVAPRSDQRDRSSATARSSGARSGSAPSSSSSSK